MDDQLIIIKAFLIKETETALCLNCEGDIEWFPKSQVTFDTHESKLELPTWLYNEKFE